MLKARKGWKCVSSYFDSLLFFLYIIVSTSHFPLSTPQHGLHTHAVDESCDQ